MEEQGFINQLSLTLPFNLPLSRAITLPLSLTLSLSHDRSLSVSLSYLADETDRSEGIKYR